MTSNSDTIREDCEFILRGDHYDCAHAGGGRGAPKSDWCKPCLLAAFAALEQERERWQASHKGWEDAFDEQRQCAETAEARAVAAEQERDRMTAEWERVTVISADYSARADAAERVAATLADALAWYADDRHWKEQPHGDAERGHYPTYVPAREDRGERARAALAAYRAQTAEVKL